MREIIRSDPDYFHKQRWIRIDAEIYHRIQKAPDVEARMLAEQEWDEHQKTRFHPETSLEALLAEVDTRELPPPGL